MISYCFFYLGDITTGRSTDFSSEAPEFEQVSLNLTSFLVVHGTVLLYLFAWAYLFCFLCFIKCKVPITSDVFNLFLQSVLTENLTFSIRSIQACKSIPKLMNSHWIPSFLYSSCSKTNMWWLKNCCSLSLV